MVRSILTLLALALALSPASAQTLLAATDVLDALPPTVPLADARGVAIVPRSRAPGETGRGVLFVRGETGWGDPVFVTLSGSAGRAAASEPADRVLVFRTRRSLDRVVNGDRIIDSEVTAYTRGRGTFAEVSLEGAKLVRGNLLAFGGDRAQAAALKTKLTERTAPKAVPEVLPPAPTAWALTVENRDAVFGGLALAGTWFAALWKRKR